MTRQGVALAIVGLVLVAAGRVLGLVELYIVGAGALGACVLALILVWSRKLRIDVQRTLSPPRISAGSTARVDLEVRNLTRRRTPVLRMRDEISGTRGADLLLAPVAPGANTRAAYRLPTTRRGIVKVGPLSLEYTDPLGLARSRVRSELLSNLTVLPTVLPVAPIPKSITDNPMSGAEHQASWSRANGDFYALRNYVVGDDLRRVHWASTARHDELMVRQDELPWQGRITVVVDNRQQSLHGEGLDLATSIAASVLTASQRRQDLVRLVTATGVDSGFNTGNSPFDALLEQLAVIDSNPHGSLRSSIQQLLHGEGGGAAVVIAGMLSDEERQLAASISTRYRATFLIRLHPSAWDASVDEPPVAATTDHGFIVTRARSFGDEWNRAVTAMDLTSR